MKKISLFALALSSGIAMFAQSTHREKDRQREGDKPKLVTDMTVAPRFGIKAGVNLSEFKESSTSTSGSNMDNLQNRTSFHAGITYNLPLGTMFRLQPELYYSGQGSKVTSTNNSGFGNVTTSNELKSNYINLPVLLQLQTMSGFYVEVGPQIGYLVSAKYIPNGGSEVDEKDNMRKMDFAAAGGIGYLSRIGLGIDARYVYGLRNIWDSENSSTTSFPETKNRSIQVGLFYQFGAGK